MWKKCGFVLMIGLKLEGNKKSESKDNEWKKTTSMYLIVFVKSSMYIVIEHVLQ